MRRRLRNTAYLWKHRALLLAAFCWRRLMFQTRFIAITGSVGKTTTKELLAAILRHRSTAVLSTTRSANGVKDVARNILRVRPWHRFAVLEAGTDAPGWIRRSAWLIGPDLAIILSVARTHTNNFPSLEDTAKEKAALLSGLRRKGVAILNLDDAHVAAMAAKCPGRIVWFGESPEAEIRATQISGPWPERLLLSVSARGLTEQVQTQLVGTHWTSSVLAAISASLECGLTLYQSAASVSQVPPSLGRMEACVLPCGATILRDDLNGSLDTFLRAFETLKAARAKRKILVITTVSDSPEGWDRRTARIAEDAALVVDMLVLIGKRRDTKRAGKAALARGLAAEALREFEDLRDVSRFLQSTLQSGDLVLLRGRTTDHVTRIYHAQLQEVSCWKKHCSKTSLCDYCPELFARGKAFETKSQGELPCAESAGSRLPILPSRPNATH